MDYPTSRTLTLEGKREELQHLRHLLFNCKDLVETLQSQGFSPVILQTGASDRKAGNLMSRLTCFFCQYSLNVPLEEMCYERGICWRCFRMTSNWMAALLCTNKGFPTPTQKYIPAWLLFTLYRRLSPLITGTCYFCTF